MNLPERFTEEMKRLLGGEYSAWLESFQTDGQDGEGTSGEGRPEADDAFRGLRVNTRKLSPQEFLGRASFSCGRFPGRKTASIWREEGGLPGTRTTRRGFITCRSQAPWFRRLPFPSNGATGCWISARLPEGRPRSLRPGLQARGFLWANDLSNSRAKALLKNLELFGAENILVTSESPERLVRYFEGFFDKILIDAPCSGEGMFRKNPSMTRDWEEKGPDYYARIQKEITAQAARLLRPGGLLLYSTCTFSVKENEETILSLLRTAPGFRVLPLALPDTAKHYGFAPGRPDLISREAAGEGLTEEEWTGLTLAARLYPHRVEGEGHFAALLQKKETEAEKAAESPEKLRNDGGGRKGRAAGHAQAGKALSESFREFGEGTQKAPGGRPDPQL